MFYITDSETGEVIGDDRTYVIRSKAQVKAAKKYFSDKDARLGANGKYTGKPLTEEEQIEKEKSGTYTQYFRETISEDPANVARFFLMCTYLGFDNQTLVQNGKPMTKAVLKSKLNLRKMAFLDFYKDMTDKGIIYEDEGCIKVNAKYSRRGHNENKSISIIRCFDIPIRRLFENTTPKHHKHIGYILMLLPYMNKFSNFLCKPAENSTIYEYDSERINCLSMPEICKLIGYDVSNAARLRKDLCSICVDNEYLFAFVLNGGEEYYPIINDIFFFGSDWRKKTLVHKFLFTCKRKK